MSATRPTRVCTPVLEVPSGANILPSRLLRRLRVLLVSLRYLLLIAMHRSNALGVAIGQVQVVGVAKALADHRRIGGIQSMADSCQFPSIRGFRGVEAFEETTDTSWK